jgi:hypothetical protein
MIEIRQSLAIVLKCVRAQQYAVVDHVTSIAALIDYLEARDPSFHDTFLAYQKSDRDASAILVELAQLDEAVGEVIQRLESGEKLSA